MSTRTTSLSVILLALIIGVQNTYGATGSIKGTIRITGSKSNANAVVYIQQVAGAFPPKPAEMNQKSMQFLPHVLPVVAGSTVHFLNSDATQHNVFSPDNEKYNLGTWPQGQTKDHVFSKCAKPPCVYVQLCRVHPEMEGYVVVLQNPFFALTDNSGNYEIANIPPGSYTIGIWHENGKVQTKTVVVESGKSVVVNAALPKR